MTPKELCRAAFGAGLMALQLSVIMLLASVGSFFSVVSWVNCGLLVFNIVIHGPSVVNFIFWIHEDETKEEE